MTDEIRTNADGSVTTYPLIGWKPVIVAGSALMLVVRFVASEEELETGEYRELPLMLTPAQCVELSKVLKTAASAILAPSDSGTAVN